MGFFLVLKAELVRSLIIARRYWFATLIGLIMGYFTLAGIAYAFIHNRGAMADGLSSRFGGEAAVSGTLGLLIGMLAFGIVGMFSQGLQAMARSGELEQLYMSPHGLITNFLARSFVSCITSVLSMSIMLYLVDYTMSGVLKIDGVDVLLLILLIGLTYINLIGFGFMIGGLVLVFKQTGQVAMIIRMVLMGLALIVGPEIVNWPLTVQVLAHLLPVTDATICLKLVIIKDVGVAVLEPPYLQFVVLLLVNSVIWTGLGIILFKLMERWSRSKGTLGAY
jgi:ABC-2 type transport system permease protein